MDLKLLNKVKDESSFLKFIKELLNSRLEDIELEKNKPTSLYAQTKNEWENTSLEGFLKAAIAWAEDSYFGRNQGLDDKNPWKKFAQFLFCGIVYE